MCSELGGGEKRLFSRRVRGVRDREGPRMTHRDMPTALTAGTEACRRTRVWMTDQEPHFGQIKFKIGIL